MGEISRAFAMGEEFLKCPACGGIRATGQGEKSCDQCGTADERYTLSPLTFEVQGEWEAYLADRAYEEIERRLKNKKITQAEAVAERSELRKEIVAGEYSFLSKTSSLAISNLGGPAFQEMLFIRLKAAHPNDPRISRKLAQDAAEKNLELMRFLTAKMDTPDPNSQAPQGETGGGSELKPSSPDLSENLSAADSKTSAA